jgi:hypothetical protein
MTHDIERCLEQATPRGPGPQVRARVLAAVNRELTGADRPAGRVFRFRPGLFAAAMLLGSLLLNYLVNVSVDRRLARVLGPPPAHRLAAELATDIAAVTDPRTGDWAFQRLSTEPPPRQEFRPYAARLQELIRQVTVEPEDPRHETIEESLQMDRDLRGRLDRSPADRQCLLRLEYWNRA